MKIRQLFYTLLKKEDKKTFCRRGKKSFPPFSKVYKKSKCQQQNLVFSFMYLGSVYPMKKLVNHNHNPTPNFFLQKSSAMTTLHFQPLQSV